MHNNFAPPPLQPAITYDVSGVQPLRNVTRTDLLELFSEIYQSLHPQGSGQGSTPPAAPSPLSTNPPLLPHFSVPSSAASSSSAYSSLSSQLQLAERKESIDGSSNDVSCLTSISKNPRRSPQESDEEHESTPEMKKIYEVLVKIFVSGFVYSVIFRRSFGPRKRNTKART